MFAQLNYPLNKQSRFIMLALAISFIVHALFVFIAAKDIKPIQSGSSSRVSVSMQWLDAIEVNNQPVEAKKVPKKDFSEKISQPVLQPKKLTKTVEAIKDKDKQSSEQVTKTESPKAKPEITTTIATQQRKSVVEDVQKNEIAEEAQAQASQPVPELAENKPEPIRYQIGTNNNPKPSYPSLAVKRGWQGEVVLGVYVRPDGTIEHLTFVKSTDYGVLNFEAYETVRTSWQFTPLEGEHSQSESTYIEVPITFNFSNR